MSGGQWPGPGIAGASRQRPGETPGTSTRLAPAQPGQPWLQSGSTGQPSLAWAGARLQRGAGGHGARHGQTGADRTRPGPAQIRRYSQASQHTITPGPRPSRGCNQATQSVTQGGNSFGRKIGHLMICRMCALSLSVPSPAPAAGLPPPPLVRLRPGRVRTMQSLLSSPHTSHRPRQVSLSLSRNRLCNLYTS